VGPALILVNVAIAGGRNAMGKKLGHLAIEIHYDIVAESTGKAKHCINIIKTIFHRDCKEITRKEKQIYSRALFRIW